MTLKTYTVEKKNPKHSQIWEWEETPEVVNALEQLRKSSDAVKAVGSPKKMHVGTNNFAIPRNRVVK
tara:strand:- start:1174 stop:1374 length:201 start_codon:yes stop_codon:yes gene_type:complete